MGRGGEEEEEGEKAKILIDVGNPRAIPEFVSWFVLVLCFSSVDSLTG